MIVTHSFKDTDYFAFLSGLKEMESAPKVFKKIFVIGIFMLFIAAIVVFAYWYYIEKAQVEKLDYVILSSLLLRTFNVFILTFSIGIIIYYLIQSLKENSLDVLKGISATVIFVGTFYHTFYSTGLSWLVLVLTFGLGFIGCAVKGRSLITNSKNTVYRWSHLLSIIAPKIFIVTQSTAVVLIMIIQFLFFGATPGSEIYSKNWLVNTYNGLGSFAKSETWTKIFPEVTKKSFNNADFALIKNSYLADEKMQTALTSFRLARAEAQDGLRKTWRRVNLFEIEYWLADTLILTSDLFYSNLPDLFMSMRTYSEAMQSGNDVLGIKNIDDYKSKELLKKLSLPSVQTGFEKVLLNSKKCNDIVVRLRPEWIWWEFPLTNRIVKFTLGLETRIWLLSNYSKLRQEYEGEAILVNRQEVIDHIPIGNIYFIRSKWGNCFIFNLDSNIYYILRKRKTVRNES